MFVGVRIDYGAIAEYLADYNATSPPSESTLRKADKFGDVFFWAIEHAPECICLVPDHWHYLPEC